MLANILVAFGIAIISLIIIQSITDRIVKKSPAATIRINGRCFQVPTRVFWAYWELSQKHTFTDANQPCTNELMLYSGIEAYHIKSDGTVEKMPTYHIRVTGNKDDRRVVWYRV